jgi:uncharacterized membrane protein
MSASPKTRLEHRPRARAWVKALSWRIWALVVLGGLSWIITGSAVQTTAIALIYNAVQIPAFYLHERWWERHRDRKSAVRNGEGEAA